VREIAWGCTYVCEACIYGPDYVPHSPIVSWTRTSATSCTHSFSFSFSLSQIPGRGERRHRPDFLQESPAVPAVLRGRWQVRRCVLSAVTWSPTHDVQIVTQSSRRWTSLLRLLPRARNRGPTAKQHSLLTFTRLTMRQRIIALTTNIGPRPYRLLRVCLVVKACSKRLNWDEMKSIGQFSLARFISVALSLNMPLCGLSIQTRCIGIVH